MALTFVFDEHLRGPLWHAVLRYSLRSDYSFDVVRVGDTAELPLGASDPDILRWAEQYARILVTEDRHTIAIHLQAHLASGHTSPGVLMVRGGHSMRVLVDCLVLIAQAGAPDEFANAITFAPQ